MENHEYNEKGKNKNKKKEQSQNSCDVCRDVPKAKSKRYIQGRCLSDHDTEMGINAATASPRVPPHPTVSHCPSLFFLRDTAGKHSPCPGA